MSRATTGTLIQAFLGAALITILLLPFQALTMFAPYTPFVILPLVLFFSLRLPLKGLVALFLSFLCGVAWGWLFIMAAGMLRGVPQPALLGVGITVVIFLILAVHPILGRTPVGIVPAVLFGFVESLIVMLVMPMITPGAPRLDLLWLTIVFAYGCVMTAVMLVVQDAATNAILGKGWRPAEPRPVTPQPAHGEG